jgi:hypothetical protein
VTPEARDRLYQWTDPVNMERHLNELVANAFQEGRESAFAGMGSVVSVTERARLRDEVAHRIDYLMQPLGGKK